MLKAKNYWIIQTEDEFNRYYDERCKRLQDSTLPYDFKKEFPVAVKWYEGPDSHCCGYWSVVPLELAKEVIKQDLLTKIEMIKDSIRELEKIGIDN